MRREAAQRRMTLTELYQELAFLGRFSAEVSREVITSDLESDELVSHYANEAIRIANDAYAETMTDDQRDLLIMVAAIAVKWYSAWNPTIHASGFDGKSHETVRRCLWLTSQTSWWDVRRYAPLQIAGARPSRSIRSPLQQFLTWWRVSRMSRHPDVDWENHLRHECGERYSDFLTPGARRAKQWERWMTGAVWIPEDFLSNRRLFLYAEAVSESDQIQFDTVRTIQVLWGLARRTLFPRYKERQITLFAGLISIEYRGRLV